MLAAPTGSRDRRNCVACSSAGAAPTLTWSAAFGRRGSRTMVSATSRLAASASCAHTVPCVQCASGSAPR